MKKPRAFTMLETIICMAIILLLAAIMAPTMVKAKEAAKIRVSQGRLRQLHNAVMIYMDDYPDASPPENRPPWDYFVRTFFGFDREFWTSPCGVKLNDGNPPSKPMYSYAYWVEPLVLEEYFVEYGQNAVIFSDHNCNAEGVFYSRYTTKLGLAITLGGEMRVVRKGGNATTHSWWSEPER